MFYVFHGDDTHSQQKQLRSLLVKLGDPSLLDLNTTRLEGSIDIGALRRACDSIPFLAPKRIVIVENLFARKQPKPFVDELMAYLPQLPATTRLFFLEGQRLPGKHALVQLANAQENGYVRQFDRPEGSGVDRWINQRVAELQGAISPRASHALATTIGSEMQVLDNEIQKLLLYVGPGKTVELEDVNLLCPYVAESSIFDLVDAVGNRNGKQASQLLHAKLLDGTDPFYLFSMVVRQFRLLIQVKELAEQGYRAPAMSKELGIHSYVSGKLYQQAQRFSLPQLTQIYGHLLEMDVAVKTGKSDMVNGLTLLVAGLTIGG
jgi:DNA polymerase-3 subunit delta